MCVCIVGNAGDRSHCFPIVARHKHRPWYFRTSGDCQMLKEGRKGEGVCVFIVGNAGDRSHCFPIVARHKHHT